MSRPAPVSAGVPKEILLISLLSALVAFTVYSFVYNSTFPPAKLVQTLEFTSKIA